MFCSSSSEGTAEKGCFAVLRAVTVHDEVALHCRNGGCQSGHH